MGTLHAEALHQLIMLLAVLEGVAIGICAVALGYCYFRK
jgi:hypothetical protein